MQNILTAPFIHMSSSDNKFKKSPEQQVEESFIFQLNKYISLQDISPGDTSLDSALPHVAQLHLKLIKFGSKFSKDDDLHKSGIEHFYTDFQKDLVHVMQKYHTDALLIPIGDKFMFTLLHTYVHFVFHDTIDKHLLKIIIKADPRALHSKDAHGNTPLMLSNKSGAISIYLLLSGAKVNASNNAKLNALGNLLCSSSNEDEIINNIYFLKRWCKQRSKEQLFEMLQLQQYPTFLQPFPLSKSVLQALKLFQVSTKTTSTTVFHLCPTIDHLMNAIPVFAKNVQQLMYMTMPQQQTTVISNLIYQYVKCNKDLFEYFDAPVAAEDEKQQQQELLFLKSTFKYTISPSSLQELLYSNTILAENSVFGGSGGEPPAHYYLSLKEAADSCPNSYELEAFSNWQVRNEQGVTLLERVINIAIERFSRANKIKNAKEMEQAKALLKYIRSMYMYDLLNDYASMVLKKLIQVQWYEACTEIVEHDFENYTQNEEIAKTCSECTSAELPESLQKALQKRIAKPQNGKPNSDICRLS